MRTLFLNNKYRFVFIIVILFLILISSNFISIIYITGYSMEPEVDHHDIVILKNEPDSIRIGDNILIPNERYPIFHKIVQINNKTVTTKGINVTYRDQPTKIKEIIGKQIYVIEVPRILKEHITPIVMADTYRELEKFNS